MGRIFLNLFYKSPSLYKVRHLTRYGGAMSFAMSVRVDPVFSIFARCSITERRPPRVACRAAPRSEQQCDSIFMVKEASACCARSFPYVLLVRPLPGSEQPRRRFWK